jgi:hypothetical protein
VASCVVTDRAKKKWVKFVKQHIPSLKDGEQMFVSGCGAFEMGKENTAFFDTYTELTPFQDKIIILPENPEKTKKQETTQQPS